MLKLILALTLKLFKASTRWLPYIGKLLSARLATVCHKDLYTLIKNLCPCILVFYPKEGSVSFLAFALDFGNFGN